MLTRINRTIRKVAKRRPIFQSEADFQLELAYELRQELDEKSVRLEVPMASLSDQLPKGRVDIIVRLKSKKFGIELKYWKKSQSCEWEDEYFPKCASMYKHVARWKFWEDVARLQQLVAREVLDGAVAIALTSDPDHWTRPPRSVPKPPDRLEADRSITRLLEWNGKDDARLKPIRFSTQIRGGGWRRFSKKPTEHQYYMISV